MDKEHERRAWFHPDVTWVEQNRLVRRMNNRRAAGDRHLSCIPAFAAFRNEGAARWKGLVNADPFSS
jgi:hypothetical protein